MTDRARRCGIVAIIGATNAGKSTLLNKLVGTKVAIVTHKVQTTRSRLRGIAIHGAVQVVFVDTPGIFEARRKLDRAMISAAWQGAADADLTVLVVDAVRGWTPDLNAAVKGLKKTGRAAVLALNKIDLIAREKLLALASEVNQAGDFSATFMVSALTGDGLDKLMDYLAGEVPEGPWLYPEDQLSDTTERVLAAEITREKIYERLHQELPYACAVETEDWKVGKDGSIRIEQTIYVDKKSQRPIVLGKGGRAIKDIGSAARADLEAALETRVHLFLHVKVRKGWAEEPRFYRILGLDFPE